MTIPTAQQDNRYPLRELLKEWRWWILPVAVFVLLRGPALVHLPGFQDEHWFSVPGLTVWREGIPRIPYLPTRNRNTFFENADRCLMALPPGLFYAQAPFFAVFPPGYPAARAPSFVTACLAIVLLYWLSRRLGASSMASAIAATLLAGSRPLMFTGFTARPDILCSFSGWISMILLWTYLEKPRWSTNITAGIFAGLAALCHPFALVFALQGAAAILLFGGTLSRRLSAIVGYSLSSLATLGLWLPLILKFPYEFRSQFFSNVLDRAGPGLPSRLLWPWPSLRHHAVLVHEFAESWQCVLLFGALLLGTVVAWKRFDRRRAIAWCGLCWSSIYLTAVVVGIHPVKTYWIYTVLWLLAGLALAIDWLWDRRPRSVYFPKLFGHVLAWGLCLFLVPSGGLRATYTFYRHWGDSRFHGGRFIANVLDRLPKEGLYLADLSYVFDVYLSGREVILLQDKELFWGPAAINDRYLLVSWEGRNAGWAQQYGSQFVETIGDPNDSLACWVDLYQPDSSSRQGSEHAE